MTSMTLEKLRTSMRLEALTDGTTVVLQSPTLEDLDRLHRYFCGLPEGDRKYLRFDVTRREVVERLIREALAAEAYRILALVDDDVVGHGALELSRDSWQSHIGELRAIVAPSYRRRGLGAMLIQQLFRAAEQHDLEKAVIRLMRPQLAVRTVCDRLGFVVEAVLKDQAKDADGEVHDLIVMSCGLDEVSRALRDLNREDDGHALD